MSVSFPTPHQNIIGQQLPSTTTAEQPPELINGKGCSLWTRDTNSTGPVIFVHHWICQHHLVWWNSTKTIQKDLTRTRMTTAIGIMFLVLPIWSLKSISTILCFIYIYVGKMPLFIFRSETTLFISLIILFHFYYSWFCVRVEMSNWHADHYFCCAVSKWVDRSPV